MRKIAFAAALIALVLGLSACGGAAVLNTVTPIYNKTPQQMEKAIIAGCTDKGWVCQKVSNGVFEGRLYVRSHMALVSILYGGEDFKIVYKDSQNLKYNNGKIHAQYNAWVRNLEKSIAVATNTIQ
ncbi:hypothetical protein FACS189487_03680 [Campylobacterota bacterium]|nr:hypothetical protein FACS189487_03680 [Campylobacterota bacterium]